MNNKNKPEDIKTGWDRLDKETQEKLKKLGIWDLRRTPGKLITKKGPIDGTLSGFGEVTGKLTLTPEQAKRGLGFTLRPGAVGVSLRMRKYVDNNGKIKTGIFASSIMPRTIIKTPELKRTWERMRVLSKIVSKHTKDLIHPIWEPLVIDKYKKPWGGPYLFTGLNAKRIGTSLKWEKLLISNGSLPPPTLIPSSRLYLEKQQIIITLPRTIHRLPVTTYQLGIAVFDRITGDLFHISPDTITSMLLQRLASLKMKPWQLERKSRCPNIEPLIFDWKPQNIRKYYRPPRNCDFKIRLSNFYIHFYHKVDNPAILNKFNMFGKPGISPDNFNLSVYSPSRCSRITIAKTTPSPYPPVSAKMRGIPVIINILNPDT